MLIVACLVILTPQFADAAIVQGLVSENPVDTTPHVVVGQISDAKTVFAFAQVGTMMYAGGNFTQAQNPKRTITYNRNNVVVFSVATGEISPIAPNPNGEVQAIVVNPDGKSLYIAGRFTSIGGINRRGIAKWDLVNNRIDPTFDAHLNDDVFDAKITGYKLIIAGDFTGALRSIKLSNGDDTGYINLGITGNTGEYGTRVRRIAISPHGTRLVALGNFSSVSGQLRKQAFQVNLGPTSATLSTWHSPRFDQACTSPNAPAYTRGVDWAPDGTYFVIATNGGATTALNTRICDSASKWLASDVSSSAQPAWINWTGGDSLYSVAITGWCVYVGGHMRWLDNPQGWDTAGPGAVSRPGIGAINPVTGLAMPWNPGKDRKHGTEIIYATPDRLWVGSDADMVGGESHSGIAAFPVVP